MKAASVKCSYIRKNKYRFEGKFFLNDFAINCLPLEQRHNNCFELGEKALVFNPTIFKRQFCKSTPRSTRYFQSSDVPMSYEDSPVFINRHQAESLGLLVKEGDILITGFGTIGNTRIVNRCQDGVCYANNVCRVRVNTGEKRGYIYALLSSKYGHSQLNKNASGSVVRYIEAPGIKKTLVPIIDESLQKEVDELISESTNLREEAYGILQMAKKSICDSTPVAYNHTPSRYAGISNKEVVSSFKTRLDSPVFLSQTKYFYKDNSISHAPLGTFKIQMWYPGIFKRIYVKKGLPYLQGSSLLERNPFRSCDHLSASKTPKLDQLWLKEGQLLITCAGSLGDVKLITKEFDEKKAIGSPDIIRLTSQDPLITVEYLFVYLQLPFAHDFINSIKYGSVIERFDIQNLERMPVIIPSAELSSSITVMINRYKDCVYRAFKLEEKAISIIEDEINSWK